MYKTAIKLRQLQQRSLKEYEFIAVFIDGKRYAEDNLMIILGITEKGQKIMLAIEQMATENHRPITRSLERLIERGLKFEEGLLFIIDGSKGIEKAVKEVFPTCGGIQGCLYHKIENVVSYLPKGTQGIWRKKLRDAYKLNR